MVAYGFSLFMMIKVRIAEIERIIFYFVIAIVCNTGSIIGILIRRYAII